jgi:hypothetical protein
MFLTEKILNRNKEGMSATPDFFFPGALLARNSEDLSLPINSQDFGVT